MSIVHKIELTKSIWSRKNGKHFHFSQKQKKRKKKRNEKQHKLTDQIKTPNRIEINKQNEWRSPNKMNYIHSFEVQKKKMKNPTFGF